MSVENCEVAVRFFVTKLVDDGVSVLHTTTVRTIGVEAEANILNTSRWGLIFCHFRTVQLPRNGIRQADPRESFVQAIGVQRRQVYNSGLLINSS